MAKIVFSGIKPSGIVHIGNYIGALKSWLELQNQTNTVYYCIADIHALYEKSYDQTNYQDLIYTTLAIYLALGLDPQKSIIFQQSDVSEHSELAVILSSVIPIGELNRMTQYKEKGDGRDSINAGLLFYPILQASDILLYHTNQVPVGEDQVQHIELTREIARRFNHKFNKLFVEPEAIINQGARVKALNQPDKKMAKSITGSTITLMDSPEVIRRIIMAAVTDSSRDGSGPGGKNLLLILENFASPEIIKKHSIAASQNQLSYAELKQDLAEAIISFLEPIQKEVNLWLTKKPELDQILAIGAAKAKAVASKTMIDVRDALGLNQRRI